MARRLILAPRRRPRGRAALQWRHYASGNQIALIQMAHCTWTHPHRPLHLPGAFRLRALQRRPDGTCLFPERRSQPRSLYAIGGSCAALASCDLWRVSLRSRLHLNSPSPSLCTNNINLLLEGDIGTEAEGRLLQRVAPHPLTRSTDSWWVDCRSWRRWVFRYFELALFWQQKVERRFRPSTTDTHRRGAGREAHRSPLS